MRSLVVPLLALAAVAGCFGADGDDDPVVDPGPPEPAPGHVLAGAVEPTDFLPPTFSLLGPIASGGPLYGAGEPGIWGALDGSIWVSFPGCDDGPYYFVSLPDSETCGHGLIWKSTDDGATWTRLNRHPDGLLTDEGPQANGDADVTVDSAGTVWVSNLGGGGIQVHRSLDAGLTWNHTANIVPPTEDPDDDPEAREGADRQWIAAAGPGHVINTWMRTSPSRDVEINTTFDGGLNWTGRAIFGDGIGWVGSVQFAPDGQHAYIPYTQPTGNSGPAGGAQFEMHVIRTADGGHSWEDVATGMSWFTTSTGSHWSGGHMAPALDVTGDGMVVVTMAIDQAIFPVQPAPTNTGTVLLISVSRDEGRSWGDVLALQEDVSPAPTAANLNGGSQVFPWVVGGAGDRFAITYYTTPTPIDNDVAGAVWSLEALIFDGAADSALQWQEVVVDPLVHEGPICTQGGGCNGPGDRALLDYFESDLTADGRLIVVYPADSADAGKEIEIRFAIQNGGSPLAVVDA